jgi:hypothetical protein
MPLVCPPSYRFHHKLRRNTVKALQRTKAAVAALCAGDGEWCPPILINAWNEWSEGAYLEPDERYVACHLEPD